ncbi:hypothetical protein V6N13_114607 [Hibiscus sabdariffa]
MKSLDFNLDCLPVWFHLRGIPLELFSRKRLCCIVSAIGHPLYMDSVTASKQRLSYAKVCIEISTKSFIPDSIEVKLRDGSSVSVGVEVPWLPPKCDRCSIFGHSHKSCFNKDQVGVVAAKFAVAKNVGKSITAKSPEVVNQVLTSLPLKAVAITPYPSTKGKGGIRGSNNQFSVLTEAVALLSEGINQDVVDVEEASVGGIAPRAIGWDSMLAAAVEVAVVAPESDGLGVQQAGLAQAADGNVDASVIAPMVSPGKLGRHPWVWLAWSRT